MLPAAHAIDINNCVFKVALDRGVLDRGVIGSFAVSTNLIGINHIFLYREYAVSTTTNFIPRLVQQRLYEIT